MYGAGAELLPEARFPIDKEAPYNLGGFSTIALGIKNGSMVSMRSWIAEETFGVALGLHGRIPLNNPSSIFVSARIGFASNFLGMATGYGLQGTWHRKFNHHLALYSGMGVACAFEQNTYVGAAILSNTGISWEPANYLFLNVECTPLYQINTYDGINQFFIAPALTIGLKSRKRS